MVIKTDKDLPKYLQGKGFIADYILKHKEEERLGRLYLKSNEYAQHRKQFAMYCDGVDKQINSICYQLTNKSTFDCVEKFLELKNRKYKDWSCIKENNEIDFRFLRYSEHYGCALEPRIYGKYMFYMMNTKEQPPYTAILKCFSLKEGEPPEIEEYSCAYVFREQWRRYFNYSE